jgi:hypothetical protein
VRVLGHLAARVRAVPERVITVRTSVVMECLRRLGRLRGECITRNLGGWEGARSRVYPLSWRWWRRHRPSPASRAPGGPSADPSEAGSRRWGESVSGTSAGIAFTTAFDVLGGARADCARSRAW